MSVPSRPNIQSLTVAVHGSIDYGELEALGLKPGDIIDFSVNANPFGPPSTVLGALSGAAIARYPDSEARVLRRLLAKRHGVDEANVLVTNGSVEAIWAACLAYLSPGDSTLICGPTFGEYEVAAQVAGAEVARLDAREEAGFQPSVDQIVQSIIASRPKVMFLCNPNNPTGSYLSRHEVEAILAACANSLLVLDEAYVDFVRERWRSVDLIHRGNLLILRSMTKDFALAGLRLGYALAHAEIVVALRKAKPPWSVNAVAQVAGIAALGEEGFLESCREPIWAARDYLTSEFRRLGYPVVDSRTNFFLTKVGDGQVFRARLLAKGLLVRDCASFCLPEYVRIAPRTMEECKRLVREVESFGNL